MKTLKRYCILFWEFSKLSLASQLEYKINFISSILCEIGYFVIKSMYAVICYQNNVQIGTLNPDKICIIIGTYTLLTGIYMIVYPGFITLPDKVKSGAVDLVITKPISSQFILTLTQVDFGLALTNVIGGMSMIIYGWQRSGIPISFTHIGGFVFLIICSSVLTYSLFLIPEILSFKLISVEGMNAFSAAIWDFNNMPMQLYGRTIQTLGLFIFPILLISNWPGLFIMGELSIGWILFDIAMSVFWFVVVRLMWKRAIKSYASANG